MHLSRFLQMQVHLIIVQKDATLKALICNYFADRLDFCKCLPWSESNPGLYFGKDALWSEDITKEANIISRHQHNYVSSDLTNFKIRNSRFCGKVDNPKGTVCSPIKININTPPLPYTLVSFTHADIYVSSYFSQSE